MSSLHPFLLLSRSLSFSPLLVYYSPSLTLSLFSNLTLSQAHIHTSNECTLFETISIKRIVFLFVCNHIQSVKTQQKIGYHAMTANIFLTIMRTLSFRRLIFDFSVYFPTHLTPPILSLYLCPSFNSIKLLDSKHICLITNSNSIALLPLFYFRLVVDLM